jgi:hypothetical protein
LFGHGRAGKGEALPETPPFILTLVLWKSTRVNAGVIIAQAFVMVVYDATSSPDLNL